MEKLLIFYVMWIEVLIKEAAEHNLVSDIKRDIPTLKFDSALLNANWSNLRRKHLIQNSNRHQRGELWAIVSITNFGISDAISPLNILTKQHIVSPRWSVLQTGNCIAYLAQDLAFHFQRNAWSKNFKSKTSTAIKNEHEESVLLT